MPPPPSLPVRQASISAWLQPRSVELAAEDMGGQKCGRHGVGLCISEAEYGCLLILQMETGGSAARSGICIVGDELLKVDDVIVEKAPVVLVFFRLPLALSHAVRCLYQCATIHALSCGAPSSTLCLPLSSSPSPERGHVCCNVYEFVTGAVDNLFFSHGLPRSMLQATSFSHTGYPARTESFFGDCACALLCTPPHVLCLWCSLSRAHSLPSFSRPPTPSCCRFCRLATVSAAAQAHLSRSHCGVRARASRQWFTRSNWYVAIQNL